MSVYPGIRTVSDISDNRNVREQLLRGERGAMDILAEAKAKEIPWKQYLWRDEGFTMRTDMTVL
jgi:hypothetical protein